MANKASEFEKRLQSARFNDEQTDLFRQIVVQLPKDWIDTRGFDLAAGMALRVISSSGTFAPVARLFKLANLDHAIPWHWPILLMLIAWCSSEEGRGRGRKKKWTAKEIRGVNSDLATLKSIENKSLAAKHLKKKFPDKYGKLSDDYLRKVVTRALLERAPALLLTASRGVTEKETVTADAINDIVFAIKEEIETETALIKLVKDRPLDIR